MASFSRSIWSRYSLRSFCANPRSLTAASKRCSSLARSLFAEASPSASIRNSKSEYLRRSSSASALDSARLLVNALSDSSAIDNCLRNSVSAAAGSAFADCVTVPLLDSNKELFPCAYAQNPIANCKLQIANCTSPRRSREPPIRSLQSAMCNYFVTFAVCEPCFLNTRVGENSPSLWPTMFSVMKTELKVSPLCTKNVWPTKSGVTIEPRDQVLIGFLTPELFILSIFSRRCDSTKGPFFNDLAINCKWFVIRGLRFVIHRSRFSPHAFFFDLLLSKIKRSLGLCLLRVLNPLASCP